ncbi:hypothetical protein HN784_00460 [bacterium]|jgi:hypothetical protein|nr:hypothetical protein [bacterium]MBT4251385.1 hypothetical protein [bacterium]MBT4598121.1 hypothetical protein [bacterium]MBT6754336.1 hypothetical protein [bacterium]MBT7037259.1 hypothetical protein [bacterium]
MGFESEINKPGEKLSDKEEVERLGNQLEGEANEHFAEDWGIKETLDAFEGAVGFEAKKQELLNELKEFAESKVEPEEGDLNISKEQWNDQMKKTMEQKIRVAFE